MGLLQYNKLLKQRNALLKTNSSSIDLLEIYEEQMVEKAQEIHKSRKTFIREFVPIFDKFYQDISSNKEEVNLNHHSSLYENSMKELFIRNRTKDQLIGHTSTGIHRDDFLFSIGGNQLKKFGSQGQQKTYLIALKLAKFEYIKLKKNITPVLLLDDIFDKLDDHRVGYILNLIQKNNLGQTFITDTSKEKIPNILLLTSPFKSNDIIVTIDGVSANNVNKLKQHLSNKSNKDFFDIEIQRSGNLKMIRVRL